MSYLDRTTSPLAIAPVSPALGGAPAAGWRRVPFSMLHQEQTNWCWCATTLSVHEFFVNGSGISQCAAANRILQRNDACVDPTNPSVNRIWFLDRALNAFGHLAEPVVDGALAWGRLSTEIGANRPVGCRTGWAGGGGHFLCVDGVLDGPDRMVAVDDPIFGASDIKIDVFLDSYLGTGTWTHSYVLTP